MPAVHDLPPGQHERLTGGGVAIQVLVLRLALAAGLPPWVSYLVPEGNVVTAQREPADDKSALGHAVGGPGRVEGLSPHPPELEAEAGAPAARLGAHPGDEELRVAGPRRRHFVEGRHALPMDCPDEGGAGSARPVDADAVPPSARGELDGDDGEPAAAERQDPEGGPSPHLPEGVEPLLDKSLRGEEAAAREVIEDLVVEEGVELRDNLRDRLPSRELQRPEPGDGEGAKALEPLDGGVPFGRGDR